MSTPNFFKEQQGMGTPSHSAFPGLNPILQRLFGRSLPTMDAPIGTPPFFPGNPGSPPGTQIPATPGRFPRVSPGMPNAGSLTPSPGGGFFDKADSLLSRPSGNLFLNLLARSGYSTMPQSPLADFGQAALATQQQEQQSAMTDLQRRVFESQIGLNRAKAIGELTGGDGNKPLTEIAKLQADYQAGRIPKEVFEAKSNEILNSAVTERFQNTQKLRGEFTGETKGLGQSLQSLAAAQSLIAAGENPVAQLAAFISTIKSIDNSTVREGELAAFESVQGYARQLENMLSRAKGEGFSEQLRADIADTINRLQSPLNNLLDKKREFYGREASKFKLDPESVTGSPFSTVGSTEVSPGANVLPPAAVRDGVTPEEWEVFTEEERKLYQ